MTRWVRRYWDEDDAWYYFEIGPDGWMTRQVVLHGPQREPTVAASLAGWQRELAAGRNQEYLARYGVLAGQPITEWDRHDP